MLRFALYVSGFLACVAGVAPAVASPLVELARELRYELVLEDGELRGPAAELISREARGSQFVFLGEQHNDRDIPRLTSALLARLQACCDYQYLALEQDPITSQLVSGPPYRGDTAAIHDLARRYKKGFVFISDQELDMLAHAGRVSNGKGRAVWGCEQTFGVTHALEQLLPLAPSEEARELTARMLEAARPQESHRDLERGHYIYDAELFEPLAQLASSYAGTEPRAAFLIDAVATSNRIYAHYKRGERGELPGYYENNREREEYIKTRCLEEYRHAATRDEALPRALLKFGHYHLYRQLSPTRVLTLGRFMHDLARINELESFSIAVHAYGGPGEYGDLESEWAAHLRMFAPLLARDRWVLIDLRPLRHHDYARRFDEELAGVGDRAQQWFDRLLYGFDAVLFLGGDAPATFEVTGVQY